MGHALLRLSLRAARGLGKCKSQIFLQFQVTPAFRSNPGASPTPWSFGRRQAIGIINTLRIGAHRYRGDRVCAKACPLQSVERQIIASAQRQRRVPRVGRQTIEYHGTFWHACEDLRMGCRKSSFWAARRSAARHASVLSGSRERIFRLGSASPADALLEPCVVMVRSSDGACLFAAIAQSYPGFG